MHVCACRCMQAADDGWREFIRSAITRGVDSIKDHLEFRVTQRRTRFGQHKLVLSDGPRRGACKKPAPDPLAPVACVREGGREGTHWRRTLSCSSLIESMSSPSWSTLPCDAPTRGIDAMVLWCRMVSECACACHALPCHARRADSELIRGGAALSAGGGSHGWARQHLCSKSGFCSE